MTDGNKLTTVQQLEPAIRRVPLDYLTIWDVTEDELQALENGSPVSVYMNALVFCVSFASSFLISLLTTEIKSIYTFTTFIVVTVVGFLATGVLGLLWRQARGSAKSVAQRIRERSRPVGKLADDVSVVIQ